MSRGTVQRVREVKYATIAKKLVTSAQIVQKKGRKKVLGKTKRKSRLKIEYLPRTAAEDRVLTPTTDEEED